MISLVLSMVWSRRGQATVLALLALFGVTAAVAAPAYLRAADRAIAAGQVATAVPADRSIQLLTQLSDNRGDPGPNTDVDLAATGSSLFGLPGFDYVYAVEYPTVGIDPDERNRTNFVYRQRVCEHLTIVAGRCLAGESDLLLGEQTAKTFHLSPGGTVTLTYAKHTSGRPATYIPAGRPKHFLIAGIYRVPHPDDVFWGTHEYFGAGSSGEPAFAGSASLATMDKGGSEATLDGYAGPHALDVDKLPGVRAGLTGLQQNLTQLGPGLELSTGLTALLGRIDAGRTAAHRIVPVLAVCLVLLACLTIFLAVGYGTEGRRPELAVVALRGARWGQRWWLATGENLVAILAGSILGCVTGQLLVNIFAAWQFPGVGADAGLSSLRWAPVAAGAAVLTALAAERRQLRTPVTELLRRVPVAPRRATAIAAEIVVVLLAAVTVVQLSLTGGSLTGVGSFATGLVVVAAALVAARLLLPGATVIARRALSRGRLGSGLAGFQLSRRPGANRLFALLVATVAVAGYAAGAVDVAARDRGVQAGLGTGADRVLTIAPIGRPALLAAVRAADPEGRYAMAAVRLPDDKQHPPVLAVDTTRLAAVAQWPAGGPRATQAAKVLHPPAAAAPVLHSADLSVDVTAEDFGPGLEVTLTALVSPAGELSDQEVPLGVMRPGRHTYGYQLAACARGCTLNSLQVAGGEGTVDVNGKLIVHAMTGVPAADFVAPGHWRGTAGGTVAPVADGLLVTVTSLNGLATGMFVQPADTPLPLPAAIAGRGGGPVVSGLDSRDLPITRALHIPAVPGIGDSATLVDLEYASRLATDGEPSPAQIWLTADAPAAVLQRLSAAGVVVTGQVSAAQVRGQLDQQGPALALWFYVIVAVLATALAAGALVLSATVDRARRVEDLSALRGQGLSRSALRTATLWTYPVLVAVAVVAGMLIALLGWQLTGWALPLAGLDPPPLPLPGEPHPLVLALAGLAVFAVLALVAFLSGRRTLRLIR
jgi:putative ABC transport system permease protein